jgi:hypothetical protein
MSAYCDDDITATEPFSQYAASATPAQLVDLLFAHCHPEQILGVWKLLRECFDTASADPGAACLFEPLAPKPRRSIWCAVNSKRSRSARPRLWRPATERDTPEARAMDRLDPFEVTMPRGAALALRRRADRQSKIDEAGTMRGDRGVLIRTGEAVLAGRLSSVLGALAADFEREIL